MPKFQNRLSSWSASLIATSLAAVFALPAMAGECPAGKSGSNALSGAPSKPVGVVERELAAIDLAAENVRLPESRLRMRQMEIQPGGIVPLHSHADRPALIMVVEGQIYENSSKCTVPILHKAGDVARESLGTQHWWRNDGKVTVKLTIADIVNDAKPETMAKHHM